MTMKELRALLAPFPDTAVVVAHYESVAVADFEVYTHADGTVILDADSGSYRSRYESGESPLYPDDGVSGPHPTRPA